MSPCLLVNIVMENLTANYLMKIWEDMMPLLLLTDLFLFRYTIIASMAVYYLCSDLNLPDLPPAIKKTFNITISS